MPTVVSQPRVPAGPESVVRWLSGFHLEVVKKKAGATGGGYTKFGYENVVPVV